MPDSNKLSWVRIQIASTNVRKYIESCMCQWTRLPPPAYIPMLDKWQFLEENRVCTIKAWWW